MEFEERTPWFPADPDREVLFEFDGRDLKVMVMLSIQKHADDIKRNFSAQEVKLLVHLLTEESEDSDPEAEPGESDSEPEDSEDCKDPEPSDDGEAEGEPEGDEPEDFDPYDDDYDYEPEGDGEAEADDGEGDGTRELIETVDAVIAEKEAEDGTGPAAFMPGSGGIPPKREQKDYPDDIKAALEKLGLDPSKL
jgi:hypothetical protein